MANSFEDLVVKDINEANVITVGIPFDLGLPPKFRGSATSPAALREVAGFCPPVTINGNVIDKIKVFDYGDLKGKTLEEIYAMASDFFRNPQIKLIFGGDHSISIPMEQRFVEYCEKNNKTPVLIHLDSYCNLADFDNGSFTSHNCVLRRGIGRGIKDENVCVLGIRGFVVEELEYLKKHSKINVYKVTDLSGSKLDEVIEEIVSEYSSPEYCCYISFSATTFDVPYAPGVVVPSPFGLKPKQAIKLMENFVRRLNVCALDVVDLAPNKDLNNVTLWTVVKSLYEVMYEYQKKENK